MVAPAWYRDLLPTLRAQALLVLTGIFVVSHVLSLIIYEFNRHHTVILTEATDLADRIIGIVDLAQSFPEGDRVRILAAAQTQFLLMYPDIAPPMVGECLQNEFSERISNRLSDWFSQYPGLDASVCVRSLNTPSSSGPPSSASGFDGLVYIFFPDGQQSIFRATLPDAPSLFRDVVLAYIIVVGLISLLIGWFLISRALIPLGQLAIAADEIGINIDAKALSEEGPSEVRRAAKAFNRMQSRLRRLVHGQTEMIAAISHDLRSATTRLQLRAEMLEDDQERQGLVRVVADMRLMIESVLDFIRGVEPTETQRETDVISLLDSLCDDLKEEGYPVNFSAPDDRALLTCRPSALRRCFQNVIDNAIKYGEVANIKCTLESRMIVVAIQDQGPGVAEAELQNILRPFYRLEYSRNRDNGGVGLGLAIAQNIVQVHGGHLKISNPPDGGLLVKISLPRTN